MSKEEPAWKAELRQDILNAAIAVNTAYRDHRVQPWTPMTDAVMAALAPHIKAAEQRGFQAGANKTGDSVGRLREQLRDMREKTFRDAADHLVRKYGPTNRAAGSLLRLAELISQGVPEER